MNDVGTKSIRKAYHEDLVILLVEDHMVFSKEVQHALPQHRIIMARTLEDAKARYEESLPNITLLDLDLPDGDGFALLDHIRSRDPSAYVVIVSGSKIEEDITLARIKGAQGYIIKPFTRAMINQHIDSYLQKRETEMKLLVEETGQKRRQSTPSGQ